MNINYLPVQEEGADYEPYKKTYTFSSKGRTSRVIGLKTKRLHHLQSDNQYRAFMIFEWSDKVTDVRESYPLLDLKITIDDLDDIRWERFKDKITEKEYVLTTTFLLTINTGKDMKYVAVSVRNTSELNRKVTLEHLEIERRYWGAKKIEWKIITEKQLNKQYVKNIEWVREVLLDGGSKSKEVVSEGKELLSYLFKYKTVPLSQLLESFEEDYRLQHGMGLYLFRYLVAIRHIQIDMYKKFNIKAEVQEILISKGRDK